MAIFSHVRFWITISCIACLSACTIHPPSNITDRVDTLVNSASGALQDAKNTVNDVQKRAKNVQRGIQQISSGASLIQNGLKP